MRTTLISILSLAASVRAAPLDDVNLERMLDLLPRQANVTCPPTPNPMPKAAAFSSIKTMPDPFLYLDGKTRVQSKDEWIQCRQPEILKLLQEYQYGYYPDHSQETVSATRSGNTLTVSVTAGGKTGSIAATLNLPSGSGPFPVVISIGGMDSKSYISAGIAVVTFDYGKVAADSNSKSGSFWTLYSGKDIGMCPQSFTPNRAYNDLQAFLQRGLGASTVSSTALHSRSPRSMPRKPVLRVALDSARPLWLLVFSITASPSPCPCALASKVQVRTGTVSAVKARI